MASSLWFIAFALVILSPAAPDSIDEGRGVGPSPSPSPGKLRCKLDLGLVVDLTKSIRYKNLRKIRESLKQFVKRFKIGPADTHVSLETFAGDSTLHNKFNDKAYHSEQALVGLIDRKLRGLTMPTRLDKALSMEDRIMFSSVNGHRVDVQSVNIVITDGKTNPASKDFSSAVKSLKDKGVRMMVVAVGPKSKYPKHKKVLESIAGDDVYYASAYDSFGALFDDVAKAICGPKG